MLLLLHFGVLSDLLALLNGLGGHGAEAAQDCAARARRRPLQADVQARRRGGGGRVARQGAFQLSGAARVACGTRAREARTPRVVAAFACSRTATVLTASKLVSR